jgi:putative Holliday junction resolvase
MSETLLAFDLGSRRIGVAAGQTVTRTAKGIATVAVEAGGGQWLSIARLIDEWRPDTLVVGLPLRADGGESSMTRAARRFACALEQRFGLPVILVNEHLSSHAAEQRLAPPARKPRQRQLRRRDEIAAELILTTYLNDRTA